MQVTVKIEHPRSDYKSQFHSDKYDKLLLLDERRKQEYDDLCLLFSSWKLDGEALQRKLRYADTLPEYEDFSIDEGYIANKKTYLQQGYVDRYSYFREGEKVQIVRNNRIIGSGVIKRVDVLSSPTMTEFYYHPTVLQKEYSLHSPSSNVLNLNYPLHEFIYAITVTLLPTPLYIKESPLVVLPQPDTKLTRCPVCNIQGKPLRNTILGGKTKIMCPDCYQIIIDMYGARYTQESLTIKELQQSKQYSVILRFSTNQ
jgi:hypothetical protein